MSGYFTPDLEQFRLGARQEFSYLITEFGFRESKAPGCSGNWISLRAPIVKRFNSL